MRTLTYEWRVWSGLVSIPTRTFLDFEAEREAFAHARDLDEHGHADVKIQLITVVKGWRL